MTGRFFFSPPEMFHFMTNSPWKCSFYIADRIVSQVCAGLIYNSVPHNLCLMVVPDTYGCPGLFHLSANYMKKTHFQSAASYRSTAFQFTLAVSLKSLVLALTGIFFSSLKTEEDIRPLYGLQVQLWDSSRQTWFVECYQRSQWAKKEDGVEGLSKEWGRRGKKGRQEEIEQHRCIMCACWHTKDVVFTAGAAARHGNVPRSHCTHSSK